MIEATPPPVIPVFGARPATPLGPADGGPPVGGEQAEPRPAQTSFEDILRGLNPLHHLPVVGMIYRAITGETVPAAERVAVSALAGALMGGPLGVLGTLVAILAEEIWDAGPDPAGPQWRDPDSGAKNQAAAAAAWGTPSGSG